MKHLREYQQQAIDDLRQGFMAGHKRQVLALATGAGKTVVAAHLIHAAAQKGNKSLFIVDRIELVGQAMRHLESMGLKVGCLQGENTWLTSSDEVIVASIQTIRSRTAPHDVGFCIIDECHILHQAHISLMQQWDAVPFIGLSATPLRDGLSKYFSNLVRGPTVQELTDLGHLVPVRAFCPSVEALRQAMEAVSVKRGDFVDAEMSAALNQKELVADIVQTWKKHSEVRPTLCFAVDIAHSKAIADEFHSEGIAVAHLDAYTSKEDRREMIQDFRDGHIKILTSVNVLGIGFDVPDAACLILARPTLSEALDMQQKGRGLRPAEGKKDCIILDHAGNCVRFGLPVDFHVPDLSEGKKTSSRKKRKQEKMASCGDCGALMEPGQRVCPECGIERPVREADIVTVDAELIEFGSGNSGERFYTWDEKQDFYLGLLFYAKSKGWSSGWAYHKYLDKFGFKPAWEWKSLTPLPPNVDVQKFIRHKNIAYAKRKKKPPLKCPECGGVHLVENPRPDTMHRAELRCGDCGKFVKWMPKDTA